MSLDRPGERQPDEVIELRRSQIVESDAYRQRVDRFAWGDDAHEREAAPYQEGNRRIEENTGDDESGDGSARTPAGSEPDTLHDHVDVRLGHFDGSQSALAADAIPDDQYDSEAGRSHGELNTNKISDSSDRSSADEQRNWDELHESRDLPTSDLKIVSSSNGYTSGIAEVCVCDGSGTHLERIGEEAKPEWGDSTQGGADWPRAMTTFKAGHLASSNDAPKGVLSRIPELEVRNALPQADVARDGQPRNQSSQCTQRDNFDAYYSSEARLAISALGGTACRSTSGDHHGNDASPAFSDEIIDEVAGEERRWNRNLNGSPVSARVQVDGSAIYETDSAGRTIGVRTVLSQIWQPYEPDETVLRSERRSGYQQCRAGGSDRIRDAQDLRDRDDGGHLIATLFGGAGEGINLVAMNSEHNRDTFRSLERQFQNHIEAGGVVELSIDVDYRTESERPFSFTVTYDLGLGSVTAVFDQ